MYKPGDEVSFELEGKIHTGIVFITDQYGTFENPGIVSYDVLAEDVLYKHIPESMLI